MNKFVIKCSKCFDRRVVRMQPKLRVLHICVVCGHTGKLRKDERVDEV